MLRVSQAERTQIIKHLVDLYSITYKSHDQNRILSRIWTLGRVISLDYKSRLDADEGLFGTLRTQNIIVRYKYFDVVNSMNFVFSNTPATFNFDFSDMIKTEVKAYLNINVYNYFVTFDGGTLTQKNLNTITMVMSAHRSKNSQLLTTGEIISPVVDMQFFLPDLVEKKKVFGNFQTIIVFKLSRSQLFL